MASEVELKNSGNIAPDVEYCGFVLGARTEALEKPDGSKQYALKLRLASPVDPTLGWEDGNKRWIDTRLWLTPAAQAATQKRIAEAFEIPIESQDRAFFADPTKALYEKRCRFTTGTEMYRDQSKLVVKWVNHIDPPKRSEVRDIADDDLDVILSRTPRQASGSDTGGGFGNDIAGF
jgi:hypothetical protein